MVRKALSLALAPAVLLAAGSAQAGDRAELFRHRYVSTAVLKNGERKPLFKGIKIHVDFRHEAEGDVVSWRADCNYSGADVDVTEERLVTGQIEGTAIGCAPPQSRQDRWTVRFFGADPRWRIRPGDRLKLTAGDRVIRLRKLTSPPRDK